MSANPDRPTLGELRLRAQKAHHTVIGNWLARRVGRPSAIYGTWLAVRLGLTPHQVTSAALVASLAGAVAIGTGTRAGFVAGVVLLHLGFWLDHVDGQLARWRSRSSLDGVFFDYLMHHAVNMALGFALGFGWAMRQGQPLWAVAGFGIAMGWTFLNIQNDCRYKAIFQRLKSSRATYRIEGGSGDRPSPPAPWPRSGRGMITWPLYKACEPHVVLMVLTLLAGVAIVWPEGWAWGWCAGTIGMAVLAPLLAVARCARLIRRGLVEAEFERWCEPFDDRPEPRMLVAGLLES